MNKNKVVMLSVSNGSNDIRIMKEAHALSKMGVDITVVGKVLDGEPNFECIGGVKIKRCQVLSSISQYIKSRSGNERDNAIGLEKFFLDSTSLLVGLNKRFRSGSNPPSIKSIQSIPRDIKNQKKSPPNEHSLFTKDLSDLEIEIESSNEELETESRNFNQKLKFLITSSSMYKKVLRPYFYRPILLYRFNQNKKKKRLKQPFNNRALKRVISYLKYMSVYFVTAEELIDTVVNENPKIIHAHDLYTLPCAIRAAKLTGAKVVYDAHEYERHRRPDMNWVHKLWVRTLEREFVPQADKVITVSDSIAEKMASNLGIDQPTVVFNSPPMMDFFNQNHELNIREKLGLSQGTPLAVNVGKYFNIFNHDQKIYLLIESLQFASDFHLAILGYKAPGIEDAIMDYAEKYGVSARVHCIDPVAYDKISPFIKGADIGIYSIPNVSTNANFSMPNKLFEKTLAGLPVAVAVTKDAKNYIEKNQTGIFMDAWSPKDIAVKMKHLLKNKERFEKSKDDLTNLHKEYGWEAQSVKILDLYEDLGNQFVKTEYTSQVLKYLNGFYDRPEKYHSLDR